MKILEHAFRRAFIYGVQEVRRRIPRIFEEINEGAWDFTFAVAAEAAENIDVTITVKDSDNLPLAELVSFRVELTTLVTGLVWQSANYTITATTGEVLELIADKILLVKTNAVGVAVIRLNIVGAATSFMQAKSVGGRTYATSATITHA